MGRWLFFIGLVLAGLGGLLWLGGSLSWLRLGRLPGDIHISRPGFDFYFPFGTMIVLSLLVSGLLWLGRWLMK